MTARRFSGPRRLRLQILFAKAFEALADTYRLQAAEFVRRLRGRLPVEEALDRYFREVGVPAAMVETVRARALITLAGRAQDIPEPEAESRGVASWNQFRPELLLEALRRRAHSLEATGLDCRMAASLSEEAIASTHVFMALETSSCCRRSFRRMTRSCTTSATSTCRLSKRRSSSAGPWPMGRAGSRVRARDRLGLSAEPQARVPDADGSGPAHDRLRTTAGSARVYLLGRPRGGASEEAQ